MFGIDTETGRWSLVSRQIIFGVLSHMILVSGFLVWWFGFSPPAAVSVSFCILILGRICAVLGSFVLTWHYRSPVSGSSGLDVLTFSQLVIKELLSALALFFIYHPFEALFNRHDPPMPASNNQAPVLLVHGFYSNAGFWWSIKRWLSRNGVSSVYTLNMDPPFSDIDRFAEQLAQRIEQVRAHANNKRVILVGHSMGGLVCRAYLRTFGEGRISRLITLGTPHQGTAFARFLRGKNVTQMGVGSEWLSRLNEHVPGVTVVSGYSYHDNIVPYQSSRHLEYARHVPWIGLGHLTMAFSLRVKTLLLQQVTVEKTNVDVV